MRVFRRREVRVHDVRRFLASELAGAPSSAPTAVLALACAIGIAAPALAQTPASDAAPGDEQALALLRATADAMGGVEKLEAVRGVRVKGNLVLRGPMGEMKGDSMAEVVYPDKIRSVSNLPMGQLVQGYDGNTAWVQMGGVTQEMPAAMNVEMQRVIATSGGIGLVRRALDGRATVRLGEPAEVEGRKADVVLWSQGGDDIQVYLDAETHLIAKLAFEAMTPQGAAKVEVLPGDYRDTNGIQIPWSVTNYQNGQQFLTLEATEVTLDPEVDPSVFRKPQEPPIP